MSTKNGSAHGTDQIGKVFLVRSHGLRECLVCGELFTRALLLRTLRRIATRQWSFVCLTRGGEHVT